MLFRSNQFLNRGTLHYRQSPAYVQLARIAPLLYNVTLLSFLDRIATTGGPLQEIQTPTVIARYMQSREGPESVQKAQAAAATNGAECGFRR